MSLTFSDICNDLKTFLESICRTCSRIDNGDGQLQFKRIFDITVEPLVTFSEDGEGFQASEEFKDVYNELLFWKLNIKPNDGLPQQICHDCFERLNGVKHFRNLCLDTQTLLQSYINHVDTLLESGSLGRLSPRGESLKSESRNSPAPLLFNPDDLVEESPETPERLTSPQNSPNSQSLYQSPRYNKEIVYAESSMGTPPPLFDEMNTEPIDMETLEYLKAESDPETKQHPVQSLDPTPDILHPLNFISSSEDEDTDDESVTDTEPDTMPYNANYAPRRSLQCKICFAIFPKRFLLKEHRLRLHPQENPYVCNICSKGFKSNFQLSQHKHKHSRLDSIKCKQCGKHFRSQLHLQRHHKNFHLTSTYTCHICNEKFENYTQMRFQYHVRQHGEKRFQCQFCEKSFHQKIHQINHERTHTKEQPFRCDVCGKCYRQQTACREHMLTHKDPTPFKCSVCQKGFTQRSSLRMHLRGHSQHSKKKSRFNCDLCGQTFSKEAQYEWHKLNHKSYCKEPTTAFGLETQTTHGLTSKRFDCNICGKSFLKEKLLLLHERQYHGSVIDEEGDSESGLLYNPSSDNRMRRTNEDTIDKDVLKFFSI
ncbi:zinc finger protein 2 homolog isoform X1 [Rhagoletis pomonella]|uniref:zinc finger protein 2 homolog isoform X1 n=1 Tax=Rhagoletis pomonella TaxID=28610 RepID=UPI0017829930|nr:zinc finger protein 2 homolog isoform X1 [Rhagoletis pomonella]